jgi:hypothetical protein
MKAVTTAATPVRTRLATSGRYESTDSGRNARETAANVTQKEQKLG